MSDSALARLIADRRAATGDSYTDIAQRGGMPRSTVHKLATAELSSAPRPDTIEKLAKGLELPVDLVTRAAQESAGYKVYQERLVDTDAQVLIANIGALTPEQRASVMALVNHWLKPM